MTTKGKEARRAGISTDFSDKSARYTIESESSFESIWDAIEHNASDVAIMKIRSTLLMTLVAHVRNCNIAPSQAAKRLSIPTDLIKEIFRGNINIFTTEHLIVLCDTAGLAVSVDTSIKITKPKG